MAPKKKSKNKNPMPANVYKIHKGSFAGESASIVCHRKVSGPCPLLGLSNLLLLKYSTDALRTVEMPDKSMSVSPKNLQAYVYFVYTHILNQRIKNGEIAEGRRDQIVTRYNAALEELPNPTEMYPKYSSIDDFVSTKQETPLNVLLPSLGISMYHAFIPDPKETLLYKTTKGQSHLGLMEELRLYKDDVESGARYHASYREKMRLVQEYVIEGPGFTPYGLCCLRKEVAENELFLLGIKQDVHVVCKKDGQLYLLVTQEDIVDKYPDIMWIGLDDEFNIENLAESKTKLTSTFNPINENWTQLLEEEEKRLKKQVLEEERVLKTGNESFTHLFGKHDKTETTVSQEKGLKKQVLEEERVLKTGNERKHDKTETSVSQEEAHTTRPQTKEGTVQESCDSCNDVLTVQPKIKVDPRFLRFMHRRVVSFKQFTSSYIMYKIYEFKGQQLLSTSYLGRKMAKGYLAFIFKAYKSGYSWDGDIKEEDMFVELELVDGAYIGAINFFITSTPSKDFKKIHGTADLRTFMTILFPKYLPEGFKQLPCYFQMFEADIEDMPDYDDPPEKHEKFQKFMIDHFFAKAPLVRSSFVSSVYCICDSGIVHADLTKAKPSYTLLDVSVPVEAVDFISQLSTEVQNVLGEKTRVRQRITKTTNVTYWDAMEIGRHCKQHMMDRTKENGVQQVQDPIIVDLILEKDLKGQLAHATKLMMEGTNFEGIFESTWEEFAGSEPKDNGARIPYLCGDNIVEVAVEQPPPAAGMQVLATGAATGAAVAKQEPGRSISNADGIQLIGKGLRSLEGAAAMQVLATSAATGAAVAKQEPERSISNADGIQLIGKGLRSLEGAAAMQVLATGAAVAKQEPERSISNADGIQLTEKGLRSLEGENWMLDEVMTFVYAELSSELKSMEDVVFVPPMVAHSLTTLQEGSDPSKVLDPGKRNLFLFPVKNNVQHEKGYGGTHWSLVVLRVDRASNRCIFVHHDSIQDRNQGAAACLVRNLEKLFPFFQSSYEEGETPEKANGYDSGVFVIALSYKIALWWKNVKSGQKVGAGWNVAVSKVNSEMVSRRRSKLFAKLKEKFLATDPGN